MVTLSCVNTNNICIRHYRDSTEIWNKYLYFENLYLLFTNVHVLSVSNYILVVPQYVLIELATRFEIEMYLLNGEKRCNAFSRSRDIIPVLNELPTDRRYIKVQQDRLLCSTLGDNKIKQVFKK